MKRLLLGLLIFTGCDSAESPDGCTDNSECTAPRVCRSGVCALPDSGMACPDLDGDGYLEASCAPSAAVADCNDRTDGVHPAATEICTNAIDDNCDGVINEGCDCVDADEDGSDDVACGGTDCDDSDGTIGPGFSERCDGVDNNCNGMVDEGCTACADNDGDGYEAAHCNPDRATGGDCDDNNGIVNPSVPEQCGNGLDDDCQNGDLACQAACTDADGDGFGRGSGCLGPDCDDTNASINPNAAEICGDGINQDCRAGDLPCPESCTDLDRDGFGEGRGCLGPDCNDSDPGISPAAWDLPSDGVDQDCSGADLVLPADCDDRDRDGYGVGAGCLGGDCDDGNPLIHEGRAEICGNTRDDNCDDVDLTCAPVGEGDCIDRDGDDYGEGACRLGGFDCDDFNIAINPGARETCNGVDDNCNGLTDECPRDNQVCDNGGCVGRAGAPCAGDLNCATQQGLICDRDVGQCRLPTGEPCDSADDCSAGAACVIQGQCSPDQQCYQGLTGPCERDCECQSGLVCNAVNDRCVQCARAEDCPGAQNACTAGGFCAVSTVVPSYDRLLERIESCWTAHLQSPDFAACDVLTISPNLTIGGDATASLAPFEMDDDVWDYVCSGDTLEDAGFNEDERAALGEVFGCGVFELINIWWKIPVNAGGEVCLYYHPDKSGFDLPFQSRAAVIIERCDLSVIQ